MSNTEKKIYTSTKFTINIYKYNSKKKFIIKININNIKKKKLQHKNNKKFTIKYLKKRFEEKIKKIGNK